MDVGFFFNTLFTDFGSTLLSVITASYVIAAIGLNIHFGFTGLLNIGQAGFMLIGAYGFAITVKFTQNFWLGVGVSLAAAVVFALLLGLPTLKLRGDYLAIVTIAAAEIVRLVGDNQTLAHYTGGTFGIPGSVFAKPFAALSPFPQTGLFQIGPYNYPFTEGDSWWLRIVALERRRGLHRARRSCWCAARGVACCAASARTRMPCAASARTSPSTRPRAW